MPAGSNAGPPAGSWTGSTSDLERVLLLAAGPITVQDATGRLVYANQAAAKQVGYATAEDFLAAPIEEVVARYDLIDESGRPLPFDALPGRRALRSEPEPAAVVGFRVKGDPITRWSVIQATAVTEDGRVRFVINAFQDITRLKDTEDRQRVLADAGAILADSVDYPSTLQSLAELVVPRLADWCVVDIAEASGLRRVAVAHPDPRKRALAEEVQRRYPSDPSRPGGVGDVIRSGRTQLISRVSDEMLEAAAQDATHLDLIRSLGLRSAAIVPLIARGQVLGAITLAAAESGRRFEEADLPYLEDLARRAAVAVDNARLLHEAKEAIRLRDDFLAMASHDMRTPLQAILANIQLAARRLARADTDAAQREAMHDNLAHAERSTGRLARLVGDLLDVAMLRSGHSLNLERSEVDLGALVQRVIADHQAATRSHRLTAAGLLDMPITTDAVRLERVLDNLVGNAVKYSPDGGEILVEITATDAQVAIAVRDHGIGIPANDLASVFEPYRRGSNATGMRGIGLGLSGSRDVIRELGGELGFESTEGQGSVFTARLPR
ncbi:MAG TPA: PAS domain-containing sensor histidine kinase [Candidatus Limnocylindria bacterium]